MTRAELAQHVLELPAAEQLELACDVFDRYTPEEPATLEPELLATLRERLADAKANPEAGIPWEEVKAELRGE